jgi:hypothetical protein
MTSQSPRIYTYKITFEEVPYYYYGVHKEKYFNEEYWGSPVTHKWCWELYTPKKQILQLFDFTDEGWIEAQEVEGRLIRPVFNTDKWCLNESCMGIYSLVQKSKAGKIGGKKLVEEKIGIFGRNREDMVEASRKGGKKIYENKLGIHGRTKEQMIEDARKGGKKGGKKGGSKSYEEGKGFFSISKEERSEISKKVAYQKWKCTETGFVANAGNLAKYQRKRGIDTCKRVRIENDQEETGEALKKI